jgi:hypothetical protein
MKYSIGIDPGVITGCAIWDNQKQKFNFIFSGSILDVMEKLEVHVVFGGNNFYIENPNLRKWYGKNSNLKQQGAGSIKRDYSIWVEWFTRNHVKFTQLNPKNIKTKVNSKSFNQLTKWDGKTNEHSRDAAMMVFGMK